MGEGAGDNSPSKRDRQPLFLSMRVLLCARPVCFPYKSPEKECSPLDADTGIVLLGFLPTTLEPMARVRSIKRANLHINIASLYLLARFVNSPFVTF